MSVAAREGYDEYKCDIYTVPDNSQWSTFTMLPVKRKDQLYNGQLCVFTMRGFIGFAIEPCNHLPGEKTLGYRQQYIWDPCTKSGLNQEKEK